MKRPRNLGPNLGDGMTMIVNTATGAAEMIVTNTKAKFSTVVVIMMLIGGRMMVGVAIRRARSMMVGRTGGVIGTVVIDGTTMIARAMILIDLVIPLGCGLFYLPAFAGIWRLDGCIA